MNILIDGLNFELARGTGIKTFTRSTVRALESSNHRIQLLSERSVHQLRYVSAFDSYVASLQTTAQHRLGIKSRLLMALRGMNSRFKGDFALDDRHLLASLSDCPEWHAIDSIKIRPSLFTKAFIQSNLGLGLKSVSGGADVDALMLTSPIPVHLPGKLNVLTVHDVIPLSHPRLIDRWEIVAKSIGNALHDGLKRADKVICVSETSRLELLKRFKIDERKIEVVYQPCRYSTSVATTTDIHTGQEQDPEQGSGPDADIQGRQRAIISSLDLSEEPFILFAGAVEPKKNLLNVLKAVERNPAVPKLVVAGSFAWSSDQEQAMIKRLGKRVLHLGFVSDQQLQALQQSAAACVFPSIVEGFGLPALEAIWCGTPCVLSDIAVFRELFPDNAYFVDPYNPDEIADALIQAVKASDTYKRDMAFDVQRRFSIEQFAHSLSSVFK